MSIVKQIGGGGDEVFVVFVELSEGWGADEQSPGRRHSYSAELFRRNEVQRLVKSCGHDHREQHTAERCGRRLLREAKKGA